MEVNKQEGGQSPEDLKAVIEELRALVEQLARILVVEWGRGKAASTPTPLEDAAEMLWVVLANVDGSDWSKQSKEWQEAAAKWRDFYFRVVDKEGT